MLYFYVLYYEFLTYYHWILQVFLLGAVEGLFSVHIKSENEQIKHDLVPIVGPKLVNDFVFLPKLQLVLMIAGECLDNNFILCI